MTVATDRQAELKLQIENIASKILDLKEQRAKLMTEQAEIGMELHRKIMRKRKWAFTTRNLRGGKFPYGTKVAVRYHTRKSSRFAAGAWVSKTKTSPQDHWKWFAYRDLAIAEPSFIGLNREIAKFF